MLDPILCAQQFSADGTNYTDETGAEQKEAGGLGRPCCADEVLWM